jgi:carbon monoxide dehydrogenase subunit G
MKYTTEIEINKPIDQVIALFDNPDNLVKWMTGLKSFEHISGVPGQPGAKSKLIFGIGNSEIEMIETITVRNLPLEFSGTYESRGILTIQKNSFVKLSDTRTKYISENETKFKGLLKLMGLIMTGALKKQSLKYMSDFKNFAEQQT